MKRVAGKRKHIRVSEWAEILQRVLQLKVDFRLALTPLHFLIRSRLAIMRRTRIFPLLTRAQTCRPLRLELVGLPPDGRMDLVDYTAFLERYRVEAVLPGGAGTRVLGNRSMEAIFKNRRQLGVVFRLLDLNNDGCLGR
jgi:hypothetical protein